MKALGDLPFGVGRLVLNGAVGASLGLLMVGCATTDRPSGPPAPYVMNTPTLVTSPTPIAAAAEPPATPAKTTTTPVPAAPAKVAVAAPAAPEAPKVTAPKVATPPAPPPKVTVAAATEAPSTPAAPVVPLIDPAKDSRTTPMRLSGITPIKAADAGTFLSDFTTDATKELAPYGLKVFAFPNRVRITVPVDVAFKATATELRAGFGPTADVLAALLAKYPNAYIDVVGHTEPLGDLKLQAKLADERALVMTSALIGAGVPSQRIAVYGLGAKRPIGNNATLEGRARNRRVEIIITPFVE